MRDSASTGSDATENTQDAMGAIVTEMELSDCQYLGTIITKLLIWSGGLNRLDEHERETLEEFMTDLAYPEFV